MSVIALVTRRELPGRIVDLELDLPYAETKDITQALRSQAGFGEQNKMRALQGELVGLLKGRKQAA